MNELAINGGKPVRKTLLPYATQSIDENDINEVVKVLRGSWLTTGPAVKAFEEKLCDYTGAKYAVAVNTGTAALHAASAALGIGPGDEVIVPAISFVASSNCILYQGATPVFADLDPVTLTIAPDDVARKLTPRTKAIVAVDYAGQPCNYDALDQIAREHGIPVIEDGAHSLGAAYNGRKVGTLEDLTILSFHPVKHITTAEGGAILTDSLERCQKMRSFRHHGIDLDLHARGSTNSWIYDVVRLGYNYRIPDTSCALGISQLDKANIWLERRREIAELYSRLLADLPMLQLPQEAPGCNSAWHLYVVRLNLDKIRVGRAEVFAALRAENIGVNVHYIPIPWMTLYQNLGYRKGQWPVAEHEYERLLSLPMYPGMSDSDVEDVVLACRKIYAAFRK